MGQKKSARKRKPESLGGRVIAALERVATALEKSGGHHDEYLAGLLDVEGMAEEEAAAVLLERIADSFERTAGIVAAPEEEEAGEEGERDT